MTPVPKPVVPDAIREKLDTLDIDGLRWVSVRYNEARLALEQSNAVIVAETNAHLLALGALAEKHLTLRAENARLQAVMQMTAERISAWEKTGHKAYPDRLNGWAGDLFAALNGESR